MSELILPRMRLVAERLRNGDDFGDLCEEYVVSARMLSSRLSHAGYGLTGQPLLKEDRQLLDSRAYPEYVAGGVGGGDYLGLPVNGVLYHPRRKKRFFGLDWSASPASGPRWEYR